MTNFAINFVYPWVLLLLIPLVGMALFTHFRTPKKYRRNRNRITALVLHIIVSFLAVFALSGITFSYTEVNDENELLVLVDMSFSNTENDGLKNDFVKTVLAQSDSMNKVGVVTFGYDQVYAVKLTNETDGLYRKYLNAPLPDTSATNIAGALSYARGLLKHPTTAKIVLISDGAQTDGDALTAIKSVAAEGIRVDTVYFPNSYDDSEVQLIGVELPDYNIALEDTFEMTVFLQSTGKAKAKITFTDNGEEVEGGELEAELAGGVQSVKFNHSFSERGLHKLVFEVQTETDTLTENNTYHSYYYIETFNNILVLSRAPKEAQTVKGILEESEYTVTVVDINDVPNVPKSIEEMRLYDEVILHNIGAVDLKAVPGLDEVLYEYVNRLGGGVFTIGGDREEGGEKVTNVYNRTELHQSELYKQMLPVEAINYTPPIGVMIIIDHSGSMGTGADSLLEKAKTGAYSALYSLTDRDYCGIMALDDSYTVEQSVLPATQRDKLRSKIAAIDGGGGTTYATAIWYAGRALASLSSVEKRHIVLISDGQPGDAKEKYIGRIKENYDIYGITFSMIVVGGNSISDSVFEEACEAGGTGKKGYHNVAITGEEVSDVLRRDLNSQEIKEYYATPFIPKIRDVTSAVSGIVQAEMPQLGGFYGTKAKSGATVPLVGATVSSNQDGAIAAGAFVPIYAQWKFGEGKVGSFMSELSGLEGSWSVDFLSKPMGQKFLLNVVNALFPSESIRYRDLNVGMSEDNYTANINVYTAMGEGENIKVTVTGAIVDDGESQIRYIVPNEDDGYSKIPFETLSAGVYEVLVQKLDQNGNLLCEYKTHYSFSYSKEYNMFIDQEACKALMESIAATGRGAMITEPLEVFESFVETIDRTFDPLLILVILALVLFLLEIAARKFKWKWIHELVRAHKEKKNDSKK